jgi:hypothetical protein
MLWCENFFTCHGVPLGKTVGTVSFDSCDAARQSWVAQNRQLAPKTEQLLKGSAGDQSVQGGKSVQEGKAPICRTCCELEELAPMLASVHVACVGCLSAAVFGFRILF